MAKRKSTYVVPECRAALHDWKYEIAAELGLFVQNSASNNMDNEFASEFAELTPQQNVSITWGDISSRDAGSVGGQITARLIARAQQSLLV
jgi:hypothetical protein